MPAGTASLPLLDRPWPARIPLHDFLRRELAPFPGRAVGTFRVVVACVTVLVLCMTLRIPEAYLSVWVVTRVMMEESSESLLTGLVFLIALTVGLALPLVLMTFAMDQPWLRFCLMAASAALGLFLRQTFVIGALGFVIGLISVVIMTVPDFIPLPEQAVRGSLWLWSVFALGVVAAVAANVFIAPTDPAKLLCEELAVRLRAAEDAIARRLGRRSEGLEAARLARVGVARLLVLLKSAEVAHPFLKARHPQQSAFITLVDRVVTNAAALELLPRTPPAPDEHARLERVAESYAEVRRALEAGALRASIRSMEPSPARDGGSSVSPVLGELEHLVDLMRQALGPEGFAAPPEPAHFFAPDAFTNPSYVRYALKGALAVMICYTMQNAVNWPGIRTCLVTCLIVGLGSEGATVQKGTLRIAGALVGAAMGFLAILFLVKHMESITSLALLVAAGTAVAGWVVLGSPRIAYAGVQLAFAFYVCVIQGFAPTWYFYTIRDRLIGILLGNAVITLVFHYVWPVEASGAMWRSLASSLRAMARLATVTSRPDTATEGPESLRQQASRDFVTAQQLADQAAFELGDPTREGLAARERLQRAAADAQSVFLTQLAIAHQPPDFVSALPAALGAGVRRFDGAASESLEAMAERVERGVQRPIPDLRVQLAAVTALAKDSVPKITSREVAAHIEGRLALYSELVPRIERLRDDFAE